MGTQTSFENYISAWGLANSITIQMALRAALELNVFNIIAKSGPGAHLTSKEIVSQIPTSNPNAIQSLERILRLLTVHSLLSTSLRPNPNDKTKQERSYGLIKDTLCFVPNEDGVSLAPMVMLNSQTEMVKSLYMLKHSVLEEGCFPFYKANGVTLYEHMSTKPEFRGLFNAAMGTSSNLCFDQKVFRVYKGFEDVKELMDVGGGTGSWLAKIVSTYPHIHGINFDLPNAIAQAPTYQGVEHVIGDMFESIPYTESITLKWVLHNWGDDQCKKILRNCWEALPKAGKVIVLECVMPEELKSSPETMNMVTLDIYMMAYCPGGKERTTAELGNLAKSVGFVETKFFQVSYFSYVIEFVKGSNMG